MQMTIFFQLDSLRFGNAVPKESDAANRGDKIADIFERIKTVKHFTVCDRGQAFLLVQVFLCTHSQASLM